MRLRLRGMVIPTTPDAIEQANGFCAEYPCHKEMMRRPEFYRIPPSLANTRSTPWSARNQPLQGLPKRYVFVLSNEDHKSVKVTVGAFFDLWQRGGTPFGVLVEGVDASEPSRELRMLSGAQLGRNLRACATDDAVESLIELLDSVLMEHQTDMDRPTLLSRLVCGFDSEAQIIKEVCAQASQVGDGGLSTDVPDIPNATSPSRWDRLCPLGREGPVTMLDLDTSSRRPEP